MTRSILLSLFFLVACGDTPVTEDEGGTDATTQDSSKKPDTGSKDSGKDSAADGSTDMDAALDADNDGGIIVDGGAPEGGQCLGANDCKLFSSYCSTDPCSCIPLPKSQMDPKCMGTKVTCFVDPCLNKSPWCNNGTCDVQ